MFRNRVRAIALTAVVVIIATTAMIVAAGPITSTGCC